MSVECEKCIKFRFLYKIVSIKQRMLDVILYIYWFCLDVNNLSFTSVLVKPLATGKTNRINSWAATVTWCLYLWDLKQIDQSRWFLFMFILIQQQNAARSMSINSIYIFNSCIGINSIYILMVLCLKYPHFKITICKKNYLYHLYIIWCSNCCIWWLNTNCILLWNMKIYSNILK